MGPRAAFSSGSCGSPPNTRIPKKVEKKSDKTCAAPPPPPGCGVPGPQLSLSSPKSGPGEDVDGGGETY